MGKVATRMTRGTLSPPQQPPWRWLPSNPWPLLWTADGPPPPAATPVSSAHDHNPGQGCSWPTPAAQRATRPPRHAQDREPLLAWAGPTRRGTGGARLHQPLRRGPAQERYARAEWVPFRRRSFMYSYGFTSGTNSAPTRSHSGRPHVPAAPPPHRRALLPSPRHAVSLRKTNLWRPGKSTVYLTQCTLSFGHKVGTPDPSPPSSKVNSCTTLAGGIKPSFGAQSCAMIIVHHRA